MAKDIIARGMAANALNKATKKEQYYKLHLMDYNIDAHIPNHLLMILTKEDFDGVLVEVNAQMSTNLQTPQDLIDFFNNIKGDPNYYSGLCYLFSQICQICLMKKFNCIFIDYDLNAYNLVTSAVGQPISSVGASHMVVISALGPSNHTSITFTNEATLTITEQDNQDIIDY